MTGTEERDRRHTPEGPFAGTSGRSRRQRLRFLLVLVGVSLLSALAGAFATAKHWELRLEEWNAIATQGQIYLATEIYRGNEETMAARILANTPNYVRQLNPDDANYVEFLRRTRDLYCEAEAVPPSDILAILTAVLPTAEECQTPLVEAIQDKGEDSNANPDQE